MNGLLNRVFYIVKPFIHRSIQIGVRRQIARYKRRKYAHVWPIDPRAGNEPRNWSGWPEGKKFALALSHDVDTGKGYMNVLKLAELEERMGFRSCFNFVPERYGKISKDLLDELRRRGFGVGVHGLKHDGRLFWSKKAFERNAVRINRYLSDWETRGFSSPSMHRNLDWMTAMSIEYSISTFDTDPFEPQPRGTGTIFPFVVYQRSADASSSPSSLLASQLSSSGASQPAGQPIQSSVVSPQSSELRSFVELPYTLPQDSTLFVILREKTIDIWKKKLDWIAGKSGMVLVNTHPDYMNCGGGVCTGEEYPIAFYEQFLGYVKSRHGGDYWLALPEEIARFWKGRFVNNLAS